MKVVFTLILLVFTLVHNAQTRTVHIMVALCDNENQGIVPVPEFLGNGQDPKSNLYWGAAFGLKSYLKYKTSDWQLVKSLGPGTPHILERLLFKHTQANVYLLADAYDGAAIKTCTENFLKSANGQMIEQLDYNEQALNFGGGADLLGYIGHDGLMEFSVDLSFQEVIQPKDVMILACYSQDYFSPEIKKAQANPLLWTTHLMAPEAYTLKSAIDGWIKGESGLQIEERAAQSYNQYQKCGLRGARNLFTTGF